MKQLVTRYRDGLLLAAVFLVVLVVALTRDRRPEIQYEPTGDDAQLAPLPPRATLSPVAQGDS